jgi:apolipoprotein D and lipocalin family protein
MKFFVFLLRLIGLLLSFGGDMKGRFFYWIFFSFLSGCSLGASSMSDQPRTVQHLDLDKYQGKWFEVARIPNNFQRGCVSTSATYSLRDDGTVDVLNECTRDGVSKKKVSAKGRAWIVDEASNAKLEVSFVHFLFWWRIFSGDYWVLHLGALNDEGLYSTAVVGEPRRRFGWILSRTPELSEEEREQIDRVLLDQGYDPQKFVDFR